MALERRLDDTLIRFMQARAELIGEMSIGNSLGSAASGPQLNRLRDLQAAIDIIRCAVDDAEGLRRAIEERDGQQQLQHERRGGLLAGATGEPPFKPL